GHRSHRHCAHSDDRAQYVAVNVLRRLMGDDVDPRMASLWTATTLGFAGVFSFLAFFGVFLVRELDTSPSEAGVVLGVGAGGGGGGASLGGALSDRLGRTPVIVAAAAAQTVAATAFALHGHERAVAYGGRRGPQLPQ